MARLHSRFSPIIIALIAVLVSAGCSSKNNASKTSTAAPAPSRAASSAATAGPGQATPASALTLRISTPNKGDGILYDTNTLTAPANTTVTVMYTNDSNVAHDWHLFDGKDASAATIIQTPIKTGPNDVESVTFKTPAKPGSYFFHCDVHPTQMSGHLVVK